MELKATDKKSAIIELVEVLRRQKVKKTDEIIEVVLERKTRLDRYRWGLQFLMEKPCFTGTGRVLGISHKGIGFALSTASQSYNIPLVGPGSCRTALSPFVSRLFRINSLTSDKGCKNRRRSSKIMTRGFLLMSPVLNVGVVKTKRRFKT